MSKNFKGDGGNPPKQKSTSTINGVCGPCQNTSREMEETHPNRSDQLPLMEFVAHVKALQGRWRKPTKQKRPTTLNGVCGQCQSTSREMEETHQNRSDQLPLVRPVAYVKELQGRWRKPTQTKVNIYHQWGLWPMSKHFKGDAGNPPNRSDQLPLMGFVAHVKALQGRWRKPTKQKRPTTLNEVCGPCQSTSREMEETHQTEATNYL